jgi:hypothetical protein
MVISNSNSVMEKLILSNLSLADLRRVVSLEEQDVAVAGWTEVAGITLTEAEQVQIQGISSHLTYEKIHLFNEATIWARAIYPLLLIVERDDVRAWAEVGLRARYRGFELEGVADGVLGRSVAGRLESPYLVVVETKRGVEGHNPVFQLYGQLLAAARLNWEQAQESERGEFEQVFGCYTIADSWTFVRAEVWDLDGERPRLRVESSREYTEKVEIETIVKVLKRILTQKLGD